MNRPYKTEQEASEDTPRCVIPPIQRLSSSELVQAGIAYQIHDDSRQVQRCIRDRHIGDGTVDVMEDDDDVLHHRTALGIADKSYGEDFGSQGESEE